MVYQLAIFLLKILLGTTLGILGVYHAKRKNNNKKMRIFDNLPLETQNEILIVCVSYAKGEIIESNLPPTTDLIELSVQYDTMFFLTPLDFGGLNTENIPAFLGGRPIKRPN
jgi:hypothetical protein